MKRLLVILVFAGAMIDLALAQAPASVAGLTFRYATGGLVNEMQSIDLLPDGSFAGRFSLAWGLPYNQVSYYPPPNGSYTYVKTSTNTATLTGFGTFQLTFSSPSQGSIDGPRVGRFSLMPTGGLAADRCMVNMSTLISAKQGFPVSFGFVIGGAAPWREILIRAIGPSLVNFSISNFAANPGYTLMGVNIGLPGESGQRNAPSGWSATAASSTTIAAESSRAGAFPLIQGSNDRADVVLVQPGAYTITVNPTDPSQEGFELIELYEVE